MATATAPRNGVHRSTEATAKLEPKERADLASQLHDIWESEQPEQVDFFKALDTAEPLGTVLTQISATVAQLGRFAEKICALDPTLKLLLNKADTGLAAPDDVAEVSIASSLETLSAVLILAGGYQPQVVHVMPTGDARDYCEAYNDVGKGERAVSMPVSWHVSKAAVDAATSEIEPPADSAELADSLQVDGAEHSDPSSSATVADEQAASGQELDNATTNAADAEGETSDTVDPEDDSDVYQICDSAGRVRIHIGMLVSRAGREYGPGITFYDAKGQQRMRLMVTDDGSPVFSQFDRNGDECIGIDSYDGLGRDYSQPRIELSVNKQEMLTLGVKHVGLRSPWPIIELLDSDGNEVTEIGGEKDDASTDDYYYRVVLVDATEKFEPEAWDDMPERAQVLEIFDNGEESLKAAALVVCGHNQARLMDAEAGKTIEKWAVIVPPDVDIAIGSYARRQPAGFCKL